MKIRTYTDKTFGDTAWLLEQWGWWRMDGMGVPRYISPSYALMRDNTNIEGGIKNYALVDDRALEIDAAIARLTKRDQQMGDFIWLYYGAKWPALRVGREAKIGEAKAREIINAGVAWIDSALERIREAA